MYGDGVLFEGKDGWLVLAIDDGGGCVFSSDVDGFVDDGCFIVGAVEDIDCCLGGCVFEGLGDVLVGVLECAVPWSVGVVVVDVDDLWGLLWVGLWLEGLCGVG